MLALAVTPSAAGIKYISEGKRQKLSAKVLIFIAPLPGRAMSVSRSDVIIPVLLYRHHSRQAVGCFGRVEEGHRAVRKRWSKLKEWLRAEALAMPA